MPGKAKIVLLCLLAACLYGVLHDQITVRLCIEYFTVAHPPLFSTNSPTLLAVCWGVAATSGVGIALGVLLALVSRSGDTDPFPTPRLVRSVALLLGGMAISATLAGLAGYLLSLRGVISLPETFAEAIPASHAHRFMAVWFAHGASYLTGLTGGGLLCWCVWRLRGYPRVISLFPESRAAAIRAVAVFTVAGLVLWLRFR